MHIVPRTTVCTMLTHHADARRRLSRHIRLYELGTTCALSGYSCGTNVQRVDYGTATCGTGTCQPQECCQGATCTTAVCDTALPPRTHKPGLGNVTCNAANLDCQVPLLSGPFAIVISQTFCTGAEQF